jgi:hypothetical protein
MYGKARSWCASFTVVVIAALIACTTGPATAGENIVVNLQAVEPSLLHTTTGERVDFVNRTGRAVHVQFAGDLRQHRVVQIPATGPAWVVFLRPGTHPYVIHVYESKERTLAGVVEVREAPQHQSESETCSAVAMGICIEP